MVYQVGLVSLCIKINNMSLHQLKKCGKLQVSIHVIYSQNAVTCMCYFFSLGLLSIAGYAVYAQHVAVEYFNPDFDDLKWVTKRNS